MRMRHLEKTRCEVTSDSKGDVTCVHHRVCASYDHHPARNFLRAFHRTLPPSLPQLPDHHYLPTQHRSSAHGKASSSSVRLRQTLWN
jgi:hypothetical protein